MSEKKTILEVDALNKTENVRDLNSEELAQLEVAKNEADAVQSAKQAHDQARTSALAKLAALGLTEEEIAAL